MIPSATRLWQLARVSCAGALVMALAATGCTRDSAAPKPSLAAATATGQAAIKQASWGLLDVQYSEPQFSSEGCKSGQQRSITTTRGTVLASRDPAQRMAGALYGVVGALTTMPPGDAYQLVGKPDFRLETEGTGSLSLANTTDRTHVLVTADVPTKRLTFTLTTDCLIG